MMVKREALEKVGPMPDCYFLYYEEFDWSMMFRRKGYELWYEPTATIFHKESRATGQDSPLKTYYLTRNRLLFVKRNVGSIEKLLSYIYIIGIVTLKNVIRHLMKGRRDLARATITGVRDFYYSRFSTLNSK